MRLEILHAQKGNKAIGKLRTDVGERAVYNVGGLTVYGFRLFKTNKKNSVCILR